MDRFTDFEQAFGSDRENHALFRDTWLSNGFNATTQTQMTYKDIMATPNAAYWMPKVVEEILREPVEPMLVIPSLLDRINFSAAARITFPTIGSLVAYDLAEGMSYPEQQLQVAPGTITINIGKTGLAFKITEEMQRYSQFDIINMHIRAARKALNRHKEQKGMAYISALGVTCFDNIKPEESLYGVCTGRSMTGVGNGSARMEDLMKVYAQIMMQGFIPDTLMIHPLAWSMWMTDPMLQTIVKNTGGGSWFQPHNMPKASNYWTASGQNKQGMTSSLGQHTPASNVAGETPSSVSEIDQNLESAPVIPSYFPHPIRVVVSPFAPFNTANNTCDIMLFDSSNLGALVVDHDVKIDEWKDMATDVTKVKLKEAYAFALYEEGLAVGVMRSVPIVPNEIALPVHPTISTAGTLDEIDPTTPIANL
jgi:hypothetical protein